MQIALFDSNLYRRDGFFSENKELDGYIKKYATQDIKRNLTRLFIAHEEESQEIIGYYTLSPFSFSKDDLVHEFQKKLPSYPIPAILIGRLAVSKLYQNKGIGSLLLMDAFSKIYQASETVFGIFAVVVDALDEKAREFYLRFGFISFENNPLKLFLPVKTLQHLITNPALSEENAHENILHHSQHI